MADKNKKLNDYTINRKLNSKLPAIAEELTNLVDKIIDIGEVEGVMPFVSLQEIKVAGDTLSYFFEKYKHIASKG